MPETNAGRTIDPATSRYADELALALRLAREAGRVQMERYERLERIEHKGPRDVVTEVDHLCEELVMRGVQAAYPGDAFYAEERGNVAATSGEAGASGRVWIVDPLDGTVNYANGIPFFCIAIGLVDAGHPVVGVCHDPTRDETFSATIDGPALRNGQPIAVGDKEKLDDLVVTLAVGGRGTVRKRRAAMKSIRAHRSMGSSSLTLSYVACGRFDVYAQGEGLSAWDIAGPGLIAERAGAVVTDLKGEPWFDLARPARKWSLLAAAPRHHATMLEIFR